MSDSRQFRFEIWLRLLKHYNEWAAIASEANQPLFCMLSFTTGSVAAHESAAHIRHFHDH
ncbi:hypothetical protein HJG54_15445 [Leptolyngbya sp. NK1-12]|uniref:Uncharacterized protein n=1 Tax=Leptolyngbya sp. NK1-12 TaxID=2547451 RepID=A0AA97AH31_9CYAN|nr:hypothetical protein [Leptolyngbya sp. NK1-12]WNZ24119.1 hypothetical protein HJG54_15445 [Leptolyngbya sp. NK1-12]